jgi:hypothetical protein
VKDGKAGFIQKDYYHGISQQEREIGLNPWYNKDKRGFIEQVEGQWMENY